MEYASIKFIPDLTLKPDQLKAFSPEEIRRIEARTARIMGEMIDAQWRAMSPAPPKPLPKCQCRGLLHTCIA